MVLELQMSITVCPWLPLVAHSSVWSTLEIHGKCSLEEVKCHCDVHLVFLEGGVLGQLHRKASVPRLMSVSTIPSKASATVSTQNDAPVKVTTDHTYSSPTPKPMQGSSLEAKPASDHTYAEYSDTPQSLMAVMQNTHWILYLQESLRRDGL